MTERDAINRRLAEWLGYWRTTACNDPFHKTVHSPQCQCASKAPDDVCTCLDECSDELNFFADESASALLLEKMPMPQLWLEDEDLWACWANMEGAPEEGYAHHPDRKTAIALACNKLTGGKP